MAIDGLAEFFAALDRVSATVRAEAEALVAATAEQVGAELRAGYRRHDASSSSRKDRSATLEGGVSVKVKGGSAIVRSAAPHSHLVEYGSAERQTFKGYGRGRMPRDPIVARAAARARHGFEDKARALLVKGLSELGDGAPEVVEG